MTTMLRAVGCAASMLAVVALAAACASSTTSTSSGSSSRSGASSTTSTSSGSTSHSEASSGSSSHFGAPLAGGGSQTEHRLWLLAVSGAQRNGGAVRSAEAVKSTHAKAVQVTMGDRVEGDEPVWVLQIEGQKPFVCGQCKDPVGGSGPSGRYLIYILDQQTFAQSDFGISATGADLSQLGSVITLHG